MKKRNLFLDVGKFRDENFADRFIDCAWRANEKNDVIFEQTGGQNEISNRRTTGKINCTQYRPHEVGDLVRNKWP